jgi:hypothetical protein
MSFARWLNGLLLTGAILAPSQLHAQTTAYAVGQGAPNSITLNIPVTASVGGRCSFKTGNAPSGTYNQPNFDLTGLNHDFPFQLDCTGASRMAVVSANGGLKTPGPAVAGYLTLAPYNVDLNLVGNTQTVAANCQVATLLAGSSCSFVGPASTAQGLRLPAASFNQNGSYLRVSSPAYSGSNVLVAGTYSDTLTVTVSVAP